MAALSVPAPVEIYRDARAYNGGGSTDIWYRWGNVYHPGGYDWAGRTTQFPSDADYMSVIDPAASGAGAAIAANTPQPLAAYLNAAGAAAAQAGLKGTWTRKTSSALSLGILPIFHA